MASDYPGSLDSFDTIASDKKTSDTVGGRTHRDMHNDLGDAIEAVQAELGVNPSGTFSTVADWHGRIGNLLTSNQASGGDTLGTTAGYVAWQATLSRSTAWAAQGTGSILVTATTDHPVVDLCTGGTDGIPVTPGEAYTATVDVKAGTATGRSGELYINFWDASGAFLSNSSVNWTQSTTPRTFTHTATAPAGAAYAAPALAAYTAVAGETFYFDNAGFHKGTGGRWAMPGTPILGLTDGLAGIGNLLTANQASVETDVTGFEGDSGGTPARFTAVALHGSGCLKITYNGAGAGIGVRTLSGTSGTPVVAGQTYTAAVSCYRGSGSRTLQIVLTWWNAGGFVAVTYGNAVTPSSSWQSVPSVTATAPAGATFAAVGVGTGNTGDPADYDYLDCFGLWRGAGGTWQLPGVPVPGTGIRPNPANTAEVQIWNDATATWITV